MCITLIDNSNKLDDISNPINRCHFIAFILPLKRYTSESMHFLKNVVSYFDEACYKRCIVILTQCSKEQESETIKKEIEIISKQDLNLKSILSNGYLVCPNADPNHDYEVCQQFRNQFVDMIYDTAIRSLTHLRVGKSVISLLLGRHF